jgi:DNA-binding NarL/FixJ family response regulator
LSSPALVDTHRSWHHASVSFGVGGRQALDLVAEHHPDAILLGLHMPVIDGIQAILLAAARVGSTLYADQTRDLPDGLTAREAEILALIARGMTNPEIAPPWS